MKWFVIVPLMLFGFGVASGQQIPAAPCDSYDLESVKRLLGDPLALASGFGEKKINRLGDSASVAVVKVFSTDDLAKPGTVARILPFVQAAFERPNIVTCERDRTPEFTRVLLRYLTTETHDPKLKREINRTAELIERKVAEATNGQSK